MIGANVEPRQWLAEKQLLFVIHFLIINFCTKVDASFDFKNIFKTLGEVEPN